MNADQIKEILKSSINSAIGIDDEFIGPYDDGFNKEEVHASSDLFHAFHRDLNCTLSLYRYKDYDTFFTEASPILKNKDLLLLDWQLKGETIDSLEDVVKIIDQAVSRDSPICFIVIYTAVPDLYSLSRNLFAAFAGNSYPEVELESIKEKIDNVLIDNQEDFGIDSIVRIVSDNLSGNLLQDRRKAALKAIKTTICKSLSSKSRDALHYLIPTLDKILVGLELTQLSRAAMSIDCTSRQVQVLKEDLMLIDNTPVFLVTKQGFGEKGMGPDQLVDQICSSLTSLSNWRSFLLSLKFREMLSRELSDVGKALGGFSDKTLMHHITPKDSDATIEYITNCFNIQVGDVLSSFDNTLMTDLWDMEVQKDDCDIEELGKLNSFLTFSNRKRGNHRIITGDVFQIKDMTIFPGNEDVYLMCITPSCDCMHPEKVLNNFAFAIGKKTCLTSALKEAQKQFYSFVNKELIIEWRKCFLTFYISEDNQIFSDYLKVSQVGSKEKEPIQLAYLGHQKDVFAQRVINAVFSNAMRIGIDLPQLSNTE